MLNELKNIRYTLNQINVQGSENMEKLLGCIRVLDVLIQRQTEGENETNKTE